MSRLGECGIDEIGGLYSIVKLSRGDLAKNRLLIMRKKLSRMTTRVVLLVGIDLPTNPAYDTHAYTSFIMYLIMRVFFFFQGEKEQKGVQQQIWVSWWW